jgi:DNA replication initiation complex subunit (GINS family)
MQEGALESLKRYLEAEEQSEKVVKIPGDTYSKLASHMQNLRRISSSNGEDLPSRLIRKQTRILQGMVSELLQRRLEKAMRAETTSELLPEEKYVYGLYGEFRKRQDKFINAIMSGYPSFFSMAYKDEMSKKVTVRFLRNVGEIMGFDLKRYGPFKVHDLAVIPTGNAEVLISNGDALLV